MLLSLCIPTNGIIEWVIPVLDSIFSQKVEPELYEVIVTDNGTNEKFQKRMLEYAADHSNLIYRKTNADRFLNQIEAFRLASGEFIKFVNHRMIVLPGAIQHLITFVKENRVDQPAVFFLNGACKLPHESMDCPTFNHFVERLSYWSSWSGGIACWKRDFEKIPSDIVYNELFPHITILFYYRSKNKYVIDNKVIFEEIPVGNIAKGQYNLFYAFSVEYISILCDLLRDGDITLDTFLKVKKETSCFLVDLYWEFVILGKKCSYDLSNRKEYLSIFFSYSEIRMRAVLKGFKRLAKKLGSKFGVR